MPLGTEIGLGPGHIVLDGDQGLPTERGTAFPTLAVHGRVRRKRPCLLWPNGWMDQDATWYGGRPRPWWHCIRWGLGTELPLTERGTAAPSLPWHGRPSQQLLSCCLSGIRGTATARTTDWMMSVDDIRIMIAGIKTF